MVDPQVQLKALFFCLYLVQYLNHKKLLVLISQKIWDFLLVSHQTLRVAKSKFDIEKIRIYQLHKDCSHITEDAQTSFAAFL